MNPHMIWLAGRELRHDHDVLRQLLRRFEGASGPERSSVMSLIMDLFEVHCAIEDQSIMPPLSEGGYAAILGLMELVCDTDPSSRLYHARGMELRAYLESYLAVQDATYATDFDVGIQPQNFHLVGKRQQLLGDAALALGETVEIPAPWQYVPFRDTGTGLQVSNR